MRAILFITSADRPYLNALKGFLAGHSITLCQETPSTGAEILQMAKFKQVDCILNTNPALLHRFFSRPSGVEDKFTLDDYAGSTSTFGGFKVLSLNPLAHLVNTNSGKFLFARYLSKVIYPERWFKQTKFSWEILNANNIDAFYSHCLTATFIAVDIETPLDNPQLKINCVGYCGVWRTSDGHYRTHCGVLPVDSVWAISWMRKFNQLKAPKAFQNGKYDNAYFLRFNAPIYNWLFDTQHLFHSWLAELPKRLDFISSFTIRDMAFWKNNGHSGNLHDYYQYNATDAWATANSWLSLMAECPQWAINNYLIEFPNVYPCLLCEMDGIMIDDVERKRLLEIKRKGLEDDLQKLGVMVGAPPVERSKAGKITKGFNPNSSAQVLRLFHILGSGDMDSSDAKAQAKVSLRHPLNKLIIDRITAYREASTLISNYLEPSLLGGKLMYTLNPAGTDTGRLNSRESWAWVGRQIQNMPFDCKSMCIADEEGWIFCEPDQPQSEARAVAYMSGEQKMIDVVESGKDFHSVQVEMFFGHKYETVWNIPDNKVFPEKKKIRELSKRTNHGAGYNMKENTMLDTMGEINAIVARDLLGISQNTPLKIVMRYCLGQYDKAYPNVRSLQPGGWYASIKYTVKTTKLLVGPTGWTRYCFGDIDYWHDFNSYVSHGPQSLSVMIINKGFQKLMYFQLGPGAGWFRLKAQIHDSLPFCIKLEYKNRLEEIRQLLVIPVKVTDCNGITRTMVIPTQMKSGDRTWASVK